ncbi:MAG: amidohydrolase family protein [Deltaproteobacteria bacterium]|nr:amidohydrolase family protein [Deltaproteobacteria bacterium]
MGRANDGMRPKRPWPLLIMVLIFLGLIGVLLVLIVTAPPTPSVEVSAGAGPDAASSKTVDFARGFKRIDAHAHLSVGSLPQLVELMDLYGFAHIVDLSGGIPDHGLEAHLTQAMASHGRISVFMTLPGREFRVPGYGQRIAAMIERAKQMGAKGFKIPKGLGLGWDGPDGKLVPVDDPGLDPIFETCGRLGMPITIHTADPKAFWQPPTPANERYEELSAHPGWSFYKAGTASWEELLDQLERRVARHPNTTIIGVHFGNAAEEPERVARMLRKYPNYYIDTSARVPEFGRHPPDKMRAFFIEFQDRILYGTDLGVGPEPGDLVLGSGGDEPPPPAEVVRFFRSTYRYFQTPDLNFESPTPIQGKWNINGINLPKEVLEKLYFRNAQRVMGIPAQ